MKVNMPVTDHEVQMKKGTILVTRTNQKGIITYANDAFVEISGFSREELIGENQNIVRHPDMPAAAFEDLWKTIQAGNPWNALVKNRTKTGDYYWVDANVTPVFKNGKVEEYLSVRYLPSREQVSAAEGLYKQLNANQAQMRSTGLALVLKNMREMSLAKKGCLVLAGLLLPSLYLMYKHFLAEEYSLLIIVALLNAFATFLGIGMLRLFSKTLESAIGVSYALAGGYYKNKIDLSRNDQIGDFQRALYTMQVKLNADLSYSREVGSASARIKQALDNVSSSVMVADNNYNIIYLNSNIIAMFKNAQSDIQKELPDFNADKLLGASIDQFYKDPSYQRGLVEKLTSTLKSTLIIGGRHMDLVANPVTNDNGDRIGTVVEWLDRTDEVQIEQEIEAIVQGVKSGELSARIEMADKEGFFEKLSVGINELTDTIEKVFVDVTGTMESMAVGDLTNRIENDYDGVYLNCKNNINATIDKLAEIVGQVSESSEFINNSSQEIASGNNNLSQRAEQQAANLEQTASSMEELTGTVKNNADNAQQANQVATTARQLAEKGGEVVHSAVSAMEEINVSSNKIAEIIGVIDEIAFQTNLLALNASVEAARAGEQGRGFSVVATEVRNLAQRSATAAKESKELIQNSMQKVKSGTEFVNQTGKSLDEIVTGVKKVGDIVAEIAAASSEQSQGIEQVNQAVTQLDEITQQNAALAEQASAASVSMSDQSSHMTQILSFFKMGSGAKRVVAAEQRISSNFQTDADKVIERPAKKTASAQILTDEFTTSKVDNDEWEDF